jgi:hypothetical protein
MESRGRLALIACGVAVVASAAGCASKYEKVEDSFAQPINCSTARADIQDLQAEKVDKATEAAMGLKFALPTTIVLGAITGTAGAQSDVGSGEYNRKIEERIGNIKSTCNLQ